VRDPLLLPAVAFITGILVSRITHFDRCELPLEMGLFVILALAAHRRSRILTYASALLAVLLGGAYIDVLHRPTPAPVIEASSRETVILAGCVVEPSILFEGRDQFTVELAPGARARVSLTVRDGETPPEFHYGQRIELEGKVRPIRNFHNPGSFDFVTYSARRHVYWTVATRGTDAIRAPGGSCGTPLFRAIFALRTAAIARLDSLYRNDAYATGMLEAILLGESGKLEKVWTDHFRRTGTFHAIVISGLHVTVLAATFLFLIRLCFVGELPALIITALATWTYALVTGFNAPAVRAAGGLTLFFIGRYFYRERRVMNLLAAIAILYLAYDPGQLFEASFQLSFLSVAVLAAFAIPFMARTCEPYRRGLRDLDDAQRDLRLPPATAQFRVELRLLVETVSYFIRLPARWMLGCLAWCLRLVFYAWEMAIISTVIQIGVALPMAIYFHRISFSGFSANLFIVPLLTLAVPVGFVAVFTGLALPAQVAGWLLVTSERVATWHARWEPDWRTPDPPVWLCLAFAAAIIVLAFAMRARRAWGLIVFSIVLGLFALIVVYPFAPAVTHGALELAAIDVGQGDSLLLAFPQGKLMLVDAGGVPSFGSVRKPKLDIGEDVVSPYLWSRSIRKLEVVVATHGHADHIGGLGAIIDNFHPAELWTGATPQDPVWNEVLEHARKKHVRILAMHSGERREFGGATIEVISPPPDYIPDAKPRNNDSLGLRILYGEHAFLLTGDMESPMEGRVLADQLAIGADVLKVCHHGSKTSSTEPFLDAVRPAFAVISAGFENSFHHPHAEVLRRLADRHIETLRTDRAGLITIRTDGSRLQVSTNSTP